MKTRFMKAKLPGNRGVRDLVPFSHTPASNIPGVSQQWPETWAYLVVATDDTLWIYNGAWKRIQTSLAGSKMEARSFWIYNGAWKRIQTPQDP